MIPIWWVPLSVLAAIFGTWWFCRIEDGIWGPRLEREVAKAEARVRAEITQRHAPRRIELAARVLMPGSGWWPATWEELPDLLAELNSAVDKAIVEVMTRPRDKP